MSAQAHTGVAIARLSNRARAVWAVLALSAILFLLSCSLLTYWLASTLGNLTTPHSATLDVRTGQLVVHRNHIVAPELITKQTTLNEGDDVQTGSSGAAFITLFDGSTVQTYSDTRLRIERL